MHHDVFSIGQTSCVQQCRQKPAVLTAVCACAWLSAAAKVSPWTADLSTVSSVSGGQSCLTWASRNERR